MIGLKSRVYYVGSILRKRIDHFCGGLIVCDNLGFAGFTIGFEFFCNTWVYTSYRYLIDVYLTFSFFIFSILFSFCGPYI